MDVVPVAKAAKLFLACGVPAIEANGAAVRVELERVHGNADGGCGWGVGGRSVTSGIYSASAHHTPSENQKNHLILPLSQISLCPFSLYLQET